MDFESHFKVHSLVSVHPKSSTLGQMNNLSMIFSVVVSVYRLVKISNSSQFPAEFRNGDFINGGFNINNKSFPTCKHTNPLSHLPS